MDETEIYKKIVKELRDEFIYKSNVKSYHMKNDKNDELRDMIYECHNDEWPNNWRYDNIVALIESFEDYDNVDEARDSLCEISDSMVDVYTSDLLEWMNDGRVNLVNEHYSETDNIDNAVMIAQYYELEYMGNIILNYIEELINDFEDENDNDDNHTIIQDYVTGKSYTVSD